MGQLENIGKILTKEQTWKYWKILTKLKILENVDNIGKYWKNIDEPGNMAERMNERVDEWKNGRMNVIEKRTLR